jgi:hypothetical protein
VLLLQAEALFLHRVHAAAEAANARRRMYLALPLRLLTGLHSRVNTLLVDLDLNVLVCYNSAMP